MNNYEQENNEQVRRSGKVKLEEKHGLLSKEIFRVILERERSRADRNDHLLTMLLFNIGDGERSKIISSLIDILKNRLRGIDRYGWFDEKVIGVILPNTTFKGGVKLVRDICEKAISLKLRPPSHKIYTYPTSWLKGETRKVKKAEISKKTKKKKYIEGVDTIFARKIPLWKNALDIIGAIFLILVFSPFFLLIPLIIKLIPPGPVIFKQDRVGHGGVIFTFYKFRTMRVDTDVVVHKNYLNELIKSDQPMTKLDSRDDPRIIPFGKLLRKSCLDELPQLINVIKGNMSLVGPRPCMPYEAYEYLKWHQYRFDIKPGITGLWQVSGKNRLSFKEMIRHDIIYAKSISFWVDLGILLKTVPAVILIIIDKIKIDSFFNNIEKKQVPEVQFKKFIRRYYADIYNVDKLEFIDDKLKNYQVDLMDLMLLLTKMHKLRPTYNVAKRYFGICKLIDTEKRTQLRLKE